MKIVDAIAEARNGLLSVRKVIHRTQLDADGDQTVTCIQTGTRMTAEPHSIHHHK
ncbi:MAG TPA: hypothetical protein VGG81_01385 [Edaphobacter sp.]